MSNITQEMLVAENALRENCTFTCENPLKNFPPELHMHMHYWPVYAPCPNTCKTLQCHYHIVLRQASACVYHKISCIACTFRNIHGKAIKFWQPIKSGLFRMFRAGDCCSCTDIMGNN
mmetsp:Transcript_63057/g.112505  ORF Transcript_63057/g.112505 Transcript_63057/m.112505 type:complete len:118 (-) Transcript_63057:570-923(-)